MSNLFSDIGRSNLFQVGQGVFRDAMAVGEQERAGNMDALRAQEAQRRTAILQAEEARRMKVDAREQEKIDKEKAWLEQPANLELSPIISIHAGSDEYPQILAEARAITGADERNNTTNEGLMRFANHIKSVPGLAEKYFGARVDALKAEYLANDKKLYEARLAGDEEKVKALSAKRDLLGNQYMVKNGELGKMLTEGRKQEAEAEKAKLAEEKLAETERHNRATESATNSRLDLLLKGIAKKEAEGTTLSFADKEALRAVGKQLPKTKVAAQVADKNIQKIDRMLALIDKGAGGVKGELLAKANKIADALRVTPPEDAKYNTLKAELRGFAGQLRLQLGLVGQTSDRDAAIMYESAGGNSPAESQKAILSGYRQAYEQDVINYNSDATAYTEYSKASKTLYPPIQLRTTGTSTIPGGSKFEIIEVK